jgi:hypothetical protein
MTEYNLLAIRSLLGEAFSSGEITTLAFDLFHEVYQDFTAGMARSTKIEMVVTKAKASGKIPELLAYVQRQNSYQYRRYADQLEAQAAPTSKSVSETADIPIAVSPRRLKREKQHLVSQSDLLAEKVRRLRDAWTIETDVTRKFQIEHQLKEAQSELDEVDNKIDAIDELLEKS